LVLAFSFYTNWGKGIQTDFDSLRKMTVALLTVGFLRSGERVSWIEWVISVAGGLYLINGFKAVFNYQDFRRTNEDLHSIASNQMRTGNYREARRWLDKVQQPEPLTYELYVAVNLAAGDFEKAEAAAQSYVEEKKIAPALHQTEKMRTLTATLASVVISKAHLRRYLMICLSTFSQDLFIRNCLGLLLYQNRLTVEEAFELFTDENTRHQHALSFGTVLMMMGSYDDALEALDQYTVQSAAEDLVRTCLIYNALWIIASVNVSFASLTELRSFEEKVIPHFQQLAGKVTNDFDRVSVVEQLYLLSDLAATISSPNLDQINAVTVGLIDELGGDDRVLWALRAVQGLRESTRLELAKFDLKELLAIEAKASG
jgi:tetratricopeptide (TPR) repeat protein